MEKRRFKIPTAIMILLLLFLTAVVVMIAYAYTYYVNFNYNFRAYAEMLEITVNGTEVVVSRRNPTVKATKADIILVSENSNLGLDGKAPDFVSKYSEAELYRLVYTDMKIDSDVTVFTASETVTDALKAAVSEAEYSISDSDPDDGVDDGRAGTVTYINHYITSLRELELLNLQADYNNIFELAGHFYSKVVVTSVVYFLHDFTVTKPTTINHPCSIDILDTSLVVNAEMTICHSYPGSYFIEATGNGTVSGNSNIIIKTPKAYFKIGNPILSSYGSSIIGLYNYDAYNMYFDIIEDAFDFAESLIPKRLYSDVILQPYFQTHGAKYSYFYLDGDGEEIPFSGRVFKPSESALYGGIVRSVETEPCTLRIYVEMGDTVESRDVVVSVIGCGERAIFDFVCDTIREEYPVSLYSNINLLPTFLTACSLSDSTGTYDIEITISENEIIDIADENAVKLLVNSVLYSERSLTVRCNFATKKLTLADLNETEVTSLQLRRGTVTVSTELLVVFHTEEFASECAFSLTLPTQAEIIYYLKSTTSVFYSASDYPLLSVVRDHESLDDGIYLGNEPVTSNLLNISEISFELIEIEMYGDVSTEVPIELGIFFEYFDEANCLRLVAGITAFDLPEFMYVKYSVDFADGTTEAFYVKVLRTLAEDGSDSQQFESSNPFDELFVSTQTNWLQGGMFVVPAAASSREMYARIEILTINGISYTPANPYYKICAIANGTATMERGDLQFYKRINFVTDIRFVPDVNTTVKVKCYYFNNATDPEADGIVFTQEYTIIIPGVFKCGDTPQASDETKFEFSDFDFYNMTIALFEEVYGDSASLYVSTFSDGVTKLLLASSANAKIELDYTLIFDGWNYEGEGIVLQGLHRLKNVTVLILDYIPIGDLSAFSLMADSGLKTLSMAHCGLTNDQLRSYLYPVHLLDVDLSYNCILSTDNLIGRTVKNLNLSWQLYVNELNGDRSYLTDIYGLISIKDLEVLDVTNNAIYRFEVIKLFNKLKAVYLYNNRLAGEYAGDYAINDPRVIGNGLGFTVYGTDGLTNVPHYTWTVKTRNVKIFANEGNLNDDPMQGAVGYMLIDTTALPQLFSTGGSITAAMLDGSVGINAFASPNHIYAGGQGRLESEVAALKALIGSGGGVNNGSTDYYFAFYNPLAGQASSKIILLQNFVVCNFNFTATLAAPRNCSYILAIISDGVIVAMREFIVDWFCGYDYVHTPYVFIP